MVDYHQYSEPSSYKLYHMQQHQSNGDVLSDRPDANNNNIYQQELPPCDGNGVLGLPYHCYNYQDFPSSYYDMPNNYNGAAKTWRKKTTRKRKLPEKILRERQLRRNERERARQNRLNDAFDVLRNTIPEFLTPCKTGQKLTQIETLRLAKHYIGSLRDLLSSDHDTQAIKQE